MTDSFSQKFYSKFQATRSELAAQIESAASSPPVPADTLQALSVALTKFNKTLVDASGSLPSYDRRQCELQLKELEKTLDELRLSSVSKPKFSFKRKAGKPLTSASATPIAEDSDISSIQLPSTTPSASITLSSHAHRYLTADSLPPSLFSSQSSDLTISDLDGCIVNLLSLESSSNESHTGPSNSLNAHNMGISSLHIRNITNTVLLLPVIRNSVLLHHVSASVIVVGCHQFRMHNSRDVDVHLAIPSNPVIEHSSNIQFSAYPAALSTQPHFGTVKASNLSVQDFSHIRPTASPNWSILIDAKRIDTWPTSSLGDRKELDEALERLLPAAVHS